MVYIFTATMKEAKPLIKRFSLKKKNYDNTFEVYGDFIDYQLTDEASYHRPYLQSIILIITGIGQFNAAAAAGILLTDGRLHITDYVINIGIAAGNSNTEIGKTYLINKIYSPEQDNYFFPRNYFAYDFKEAGLYSGMAPVHDFSQRNANEPLLFDMEAAGIFTAITHRLHPDRIFFLKTVSDHGTDEIAKSSDDIRKVMNSFPDENIINFIELLRDKSQDEIEAAEDLDYDNDDANLHTYLYANGKEVRFNYYEELNCSESMLHELLKLQKFSWQEGINIENKLCEMIKENRLPEKSRAESKKLIEEIKDYLLSSL